MARKHVHSPDITGQVFGRWEAISFSWLSRGGAMWKCRCSCGTEKDVCIGNLRLGFTVSCGCYRRETLTSHPRARKHLKTARGECNIWAGMKDRCLNPHNSKFSDYGGRGITVCERWLNSFSHFYEDMGPRPGREYSIDRVDNDMGYFPENCRWATREVQANNRRTNRMVKVGFCELTAAQWDVERGFNKGTVGNRLRQGWSAHDAVFRPIKGYPKIKQAAIA